MGLLQRADVTLGDFYKQLNLEEEMTAAEEVALLHRVLGNE